MIIIPAVDIRGGKCVRLEQGRPENETVYFPDPVEAARLWESQGAVILHVVDLDGAFSGGMKNMDIILQIAADLDIPVQTGGGIRDYETVSRLISGGVSRVIIGTSALKDRVFLESVLRNFPESLTVGIDSVDGKVAVSGWKDVTSMSARDFARDMESMGVGEIIVTDIKKDGMLSGPGLECIETIASAVDIPVTAAGGISSLEDIKKLNSLNLKNLKGAIVGKALYRDRNFLAEAIRITEGA